MSDTPTSNRLLDQIKWPVVAMFFVACATVFALVFWGQQKLGDLSTFIIAVFGVISAAYLRQISKDTNGNLSKRDAEIAELRAQLNMLHNVRTTETAQLAKQVPTTASLPSTLTADPYAPAVDALSAATVSVPTIQRT